MSENVRIGIIGAGNFTRRRLLPNLLSIPGVEVVAVANRSLASSERVARESSIPNALGDWRELLARNDVDAVVVGTQPYFHHQAVTSALEAGKHVLCVPRMATSVRDAREMLRKVEETGLKAMLVGTSSSVPVNRYVGHLLATGYVGQVRQVFAHSFTSDYVDSKAPLHRRQDARPFGVINPMSLGSSWEVLRRWFGDPARILAWGKTFTRRRADGPGGPPIAVELPDAITVVAETPTGPVVTCIQSGVAMFGRDRIEIFGEEGTLVLQAREGLMGARKGDEELRPLAVPSEYEDSSRLEEDFIRLVRGEIAEAPLSFYDGVKNVEFLEAAHRSVVEGRWVELPLP